MKIHSRMGGVLTLSALILFGSTFTTNSINVQAETVQQLEAEKASVDQKIQQLNNQIAAFQKSLAVKSEEFNATTKKIAETNVSIEETQKRIDERTGIIADRLVAYQRQDSVLDTYIEVIFSSDSIVDIVDRVSSIKTILDADKKLIAKQEEDSKKLASQKEELVKVEEQQRIQFQELQEQEAELDAMIAENKAESLRLQLEIADQKEKERLEAEQRQAEQEALALRELQNTSFGENAQTQGAQGSTNTESQTAQSSTNNESQVSNSTTTETKAKEKTEAKQNTSESSKKVVSGLSGAIAEAKKYIGMSYVYGGSSPSTGFDCSGLTYWSYKQAGISIPRSSGAQYLATTHISQSEATAGDLVFFSYGSGIAHVGIYLGNGQMLNAQNRGVKIESINASWWKPYLVGFGRI